MIGNYSSLNKSYFTLLMIGFLSLAVSAAAFFSSNSLFFPLLAISLVLILAGILCKVLVWYNVYSEVVTKEEFKRVTASGSVFQKRVRK